MRNLLLSFSILLLLASSARSQDLPDIENIRYQYMDYSVYKGSNEGWVQTARVTPHYTGGVLDTIRIDRKNQDGSYSTFRRIVYSPFSLFPTRAVTEEWNGAWQVVRIDSTAYISGIRTARYSYLYSGGALDSTARSRYEYNGEGKVQLRHDEALVNGNWVLVKKSAYIYDDQYNVWGVEDSTFNGQVFIQTGRELRDFIDSDLDEITREVGEHPDFTGTEKFRYWYSKKWNPALSYSVAEKELYFDTLAGAEQTRAVVIKNANAEPVIIGGIKVKSAKNFRLQDPITTSYAVPANSELHVPVIFTPNKRGIFKDSLIITVNAGVTSGVSLYGVARSAVLVIDEAPINFGIIDPGASSVVTVTLSNSGDAALRIDSITAAPAAFTSLSSFPQMLQPGASVSLSLEFTHDVPGVYNGVYTIHLQSGDTSFNATGIVRSPVAPRGILTLDKIHIDHDTVLIGEHSLIDLTIGNIGDTTIFIDTIVMGEGHRVSDAGPFELQPAQQRVIAVRFDPTSVGNYNSPLTIFYHDGREPQDTTLVLDGFGAEKPTEGVAPPHIAEQIRAWPNPVRDALKIQVGNVRVTGVYLASITGQRYPIIEAALRDGVIDASMLPSGTTYLVLETEDGLVVKRIVIER